MDNKLKYWKGRTPDEKAEIIRVVKVTPVYMSSVFNGRPASPSLVAKLVELTGLTKHDFRPDIYDKGE